MYNEWTSLSPVITDNCSTAQKCSVLNKFSGLAGKEVAIAVVKQLSGNLGISNQAEPSIFDTDHEVNWCMNVLCYGLSLPLTEHETIKDCVNVYCEWISALHPNPRVCVPKPIIDDPNIYACKIISHFHNLFVPRQGDGPDTINRQAVLCHRVLRTLQHTAQMSQILTRETWEALLLFLLAINEILLAPPTVKDDVGDQLCERVLSVLFEVWLLACVRCFPSPSLWKTLQESCSMWRHRIALIEQWNRVNLALTARLLEFTYGSAFPELKILEEDASLIPSGMTNDCIAQTWYRFLRIIGSPTTLCSPNQISHTPHFMQYCLLKEVGMEPHHHPCLSSLPQIFLKAIKGISSQVDAFLGLSKTSLIGLTSSRNTNMHSTTTPNSGPTSSTSFTSIISIGQDNRPPLAQARPKCNSVLHLLGEWLFEASLIGSDSWFENTKKQATEASRRPSSMIMDNRKGSLSLSQPSSLNEPTDLPIGLTIDRYESGRAEAIGALCRIFCAKKTGEEILPVYLARFYMSLQQGLRITDTRECEETLASILYNSSDLFRLDLDGIQVLLPSFISALELVLPDKDLKIKCQSIIFNKTELRRASINILISILALPLHFQTLPIRDITGVAGGDKITFLQLKPRLINILMNALQVETDGQNTHMLLGGMLLIVQDAANYEEMDVQSDLCQSSPVASDSNILSSACSEKSAGSIVSGGNSSIGGNSTATLGNNDISITLSDDFPAELLHEFEMISTYDNAHALFVRATYLVCHRLISTWKTDLNVSLAALELLSGLARMHIKDSEALECKRAVKWICDYICYQCSRPPPSHSKDLHSSIVAAFQCTSAWLMQHPYLLQDKDCLTTVLEVVELGISGSKSIGKLGESVKFKDDKELKPSSMRVRDAAENLLTVILEQVGYFPSECGPQSVSSLLDEVALIKHCNSWMGSVTREQAVQKFKYFVTENSTVLALLEEPLGNDQDPQPTVTLLIRGPFGRHAWTMQLRHLPRSKSCTKYHAPNPGRPVPMNDMPQRQEIEQRNFPEGVERVQPCVADFSIPTLDTIIDKIGTESTKQLFQLLETQTVYEKLAWAETESSVDSLSHSHESVPPSVCHEFQAVRLFLSHFGFLTMDDGSNGDNKSGTSPDVIQQTTSPLLTVLDVKNENFSTDLGLLDKMSPRTCDTVHIFYVKVGQNTEQEIIENTAAENIQSLDQHFWNMTHNLGTSVSIDEHSGWTGFVASSWKINNNCDPDPPHTQHLNNDHLKIFNGEKRILYWADVGSEIAFVMPNKWNTIADENDGSCLSTEPINQSGNNNILYERSLSEMPHQNIKSTVDQSQNTQYSNKSMLGQKPRTLSLDFDKKNEPVASSRRRTGASKALSQSNTKIMLVWLESFEDHLTFPTEDMLAYTKTGDESINGQFPRAADVHIIFLQALSSGLLRVKLQGPSGRMNFATPLIDGMVVSRRVVGNLVRQTAHNMSRRRRLDNDIYQMPHVRRRLKVQDLVQKYKMDMSEPELLANLFKTSA